MDLYAYVMVIVLCSFVSFTIFTEMFNDYMVVERYNYNVYGMDSTTPRQVYVPILPADEGTFKAQPIDNITFLEPSFQDVEECVLNNLESINSVYTDNNPFYTYMNEDTELSEVAEFEFEIDVWEDDGCKMHHLAQNEQPETRS